MSRSRPRQTLRSKPTAYIISSNIFWLLITTMETFPYAYWLSLHESADQAIAEILFRFLSSWLFEPFTLILTTLNHAQNSVKEILRVPSYVSSETFIVKSYRFQIWAHISISKFSILTKFRTIWHRELFSKLHNF